MHVFGLRSLLAYWTTQYASAIFLAPLAMEIDGVLFHGSDKMAYKFKPNKSVAKRLRLTKTGKLKRHHGFTSHLMSARSANARRKLRHPAILSETHAKNMRELMGVSGTRPNRTRHLRALAAKAKAEGAQTETTAAVESPAKKPASKRK